MANVIEVAIGVLAEERHGAWQILIAQRLERSVLGGYWEFPGGKIERGESARQCLVREFIEELSISVRVGDEMPMIEHRYTHGHVRLHPFYCSRISGQPRNIAVAQHRWVLPGRLRDYQFPEANQPLIERLVAGFESSRPTCRVRNTPLP